MKIKIAKIDRVTKKARFISVKKAAKELSERNNFPDITTLRSSLYSGGRLQTKTHFYIADDVYAKDLREGYSF